MTGEFQTYKPYQTVTFPIGSGEIFLFLDKDTKLATSIVRRSLSLVALTCTNREDIDQRHRSESTLLITFNKQVTKFKVQHACCIHDQQMHSKLLHLQNLQVSTYDHPKQKPRDFEASHMQTFLIIKFRYKWTATKQETRISQSP